MSDTVLRTHFSTIDYIVFICLLMSSSLIGIYFWYKSRSDVDNEEFLTGKRRLSMFPVAMSLVASFMSTNTLLGLPAEVYQMGTQFSVQVISFAIAVLLAAQVFLPIYYRLEVLSVNEYLLKRFDAQYIRLAGTIGFLLSTIPYMAVVLYGPALALSSVTPLSISTSILVVGTICTFYTSIGGIKAVIFTDILQLILMFAGVLMVIVQGVSEAGGLTEMWRINERGGRVKFFDMNFNLYTNDNFWNVVFGTTIIWCANYCCSQTQVQRYCSLESAQKAKQTLYWNLPGLMILSLMAVVSGMVIFAKYHDCDPITLGLIERHDQLMPFFVMDTLSKYPGLPGLFVACVFSGSLSTLSSGFNALAAVTWEDLIRERVKYMSGSRALTVTKLIATFFGLLTIGLAFVVGNAGTVLQASISLVGSMVGPLFALFALGVFYPYATAPGSLIGFISGIAVSLFLSIGSLIIPKPRVSLPTTVDNCPAHVLSFVYSIHKSIPNSTFVTSYDNPKGLAQVFHISYLLLPMIGFVVALTTGALCSLCVGKSSEILNHKLMSPLSKRIFRDFSQKQTKANSTEMNAMEVLI